VDISLYASKLVPGGAGHGSIAIPGSHVEDAIAIGYGTVCTDPFAYTIRNTTDGDGDDIPEQVFYSLYADIFGESGLGGARITWHRQVSPPPATATFTDVPTSSNEFAFIEALFASGVTAGCGSGKYCPDAPLTRRQMAVFLAKALGLHWAD
jgi:hypothetical protein